MDIEESSHEPLETRISVNINDLRLDENNPRIEQDEDQKTIINHLLEEEGADELAKDIAEKSSLNPLDNIGVMEDEGTYVVLEGNRRCAAIKALNNPELITSNGLKNKIKKAIEEFDYKQISEIDCVQFSSREDANEFIRIRHGGEASGVGTKRWDATQNETFRKRNNYKPLYGLATELMDWAASNDVISGHDRKELAITNIERMVKSPAVKTKMGIVVDTDASLLSNYSFYWLAAFIKEMVRRERLPQGDQQRINANNAYSSKDRERIANEIVAKIRSKGAQDSHLPHPIHLKKLKRVTETASSDNSTDPETGNSEIDTQEASADKTEQSQNSDSQEGTDYTPSANDTNDQKTDSDDDKPSNNGYLPDASRRKLLFSSNFRPNVENHILARLIREIKKLHVIDFRVSSIFLIRALLEGVFGEFCKQKALDNGNNQLELHKKIMKTCDYIMDNNNGHVADARRDGNSMKALKTIASDQNKMLSPNQINNIVHGGTSAPAASEIIAAWDQIEREVLFVTKLLWPRNK